MLNQFILLSLITALTSCLIGCASTHSISNVNSKLEKDQFQIKIKSPAKIGFLKSLKKGVNCKNINRDDFRISFKKSKKEIPFT